MIEIPAWGNATLIEIIWLCTGLFVLAVTGRHIRSLYLDWRAAVASGRPVLEAVASGNLILELIFIAQGVAIAGLGIFSVLQPPAIPGPTVTTPTGLFITAVLVLIALLVAIASISGWRKQERVRGYIKAEAPTDNAILLVDGDGIVKYSNNVADLVFGRRLVGVRVEELIPERLRTAHVEHRAEYGKHPEPRPMGLHLGTKGVRPDGTEFPILATLSPFTDEVGTMYTMVTAKLDTESVIDESDNSA